MSSPATRAAVSIVCVYNDPRVLESCLARSVREGLAEAPETEFLPVDNCAGAFPTAGAALNHGARLARHDVVVFVHQDVFLHSLRRVETVAGQLLGDRRIGVLGAVGMDRRGSVVGRVRDRVVPIGRSVTEPTDVDTLDEVLFMVRREQVLREPLAEDPRLAWHAYAVEYCLRVRRAGQRAAAVDVSLTHNSLTANLARLDVAHRTVGEWYPALLPIRTTCGTVRRTEGPGGVLRLVRRARGARTWWRESLAASELARVGTPRPLLADIRILIDDAARLGAMASVRAIDVAHDGTSITALGGLERLGRGFSAATLAWGAVVEEIAARPASELLVVSHLTPGEVLALQTVADQPPIVGLSRDTGLWVLLGAPQEVLAPLWSRRRNRPFAGVLQGVRVAA